MVNMSSWGRLTHDAHKLITLEDRHSLPATEPHLSGLARGLGRSYGDSCLNQGNLLWLTGGIDRFISFDEDSGVLVCEAGVSLADIQQTFAPRGWFLPVSPGTQFVTVGGAVANDVHGKNHHLYGSFGNHVTSLELARTTGEVLSCSLEQNVGMFSATIGGLGLTGVILSVGLQLRRIPGTWINETSVPFDSLAGFFELSDRYQQEKEYCVAWFDCLDSRCRGLLSTGDHAVNSFSAEPRKKPRSVFFTPPLSLVNKLSVLAFNRLYFSVGKRKTKNRLSHYRPFLYPLDNVLNMNRIYGPKGFYQYQCVIPEANRLDATLELMRLIRQSGMGSFLSVLKTFGSIPSKGLLSFPREGVTLALDFPNGGRKLLDLFSRLDQVVLAARGRIYLAKDARLPREAFEQMYPQVEEFSAFRDPGISSSMSRRLMEF